MRKTKFKKGVIIISTFIILILSIGMISATSIDSGNSLSDSSGIDSDSVSTTSDINSDDSDNIGEGEVSDASDNMSDVSGNVGDGEVSDASDNLSSANNTNEEIQNDGEKTLAELQALIDSSTENDVIELSGTYSGNDVLKINKSLSFLGIGDMAVIRGEDRENFMEFADAISIKFENIKIVSEKYSRIFSDSIVFDLKNSVFENLSFGTMYGRIDVNDCSFSNSYLFWEYAGGNIKNSNFTNNSQLSFAQDAFVDIINCNFANGNRTAIWLYQGANIYNCTFVNLSGEYGGAISGAIKDVKNCVFINNSAKYGGAIYSDPWGGFNSIENCSFINNSAELGAAIFWNSSRNITIKNCIFDNNHKSDSNSTGTTLYFIADDSSNINYSKLNITASNNFWACDKVVLSDIFKSAKGETFTLGDILSLKLESNGNNSYTLYFSTSSGSKVSKMPDYQISLKDRRDDSIIVKDLLMVNGQGTFNYGKDVSMDVIDIVGQGGKSVSRLSTKVIPTKLTTYYLSGRTFNVQVVDKYSKKAISGMKLTLKVFTGKSYKYYYVTTDSKGIAKFKATSLAIGTHKVEITGSHKNYNVVKTTSSIKINKAKTIVSAPKVTVKYKKSYYFKVTVKHYSTKKYIKGLKLKLRIYTGNKYKTFTVKTNTKGLAKFNTKNLRRGTHKVVILSGNSKFIVSKNSSIRIR